MKNKPFMIIFIIIHFVFTLLTMGFIRLHNLYEGVNIFYNIFQVLICIIIIVTIWGILKKMKWSKSISVIILLYVCLFHSYKFFLTLINSVNNDFDSIALSFFLLIWPFVNLIYLFFFSKKDNYFTK